MDIKTKAFTFGDMPKLEHTDVRCPSCGHSELHHCILYDYGIVRCYIKAGCPCAREYES